MFTMLAAIAGSLIGGALPATDVGNGHAVFGVDVLIRARPADVEGSISRRGGRTNR